MNKNGHEYASINRIYFVKYYYSLYFNYINFWNMICIYFITFANTHFEMSIDVVHIDRSYLNRLENIVLLKWFDYYYFFPEKIIIRWII